jgi:hypothetical protein
VAADVVVGMKRIDAVHEAPIWAERANFIIGAPLPEEGRAEQLCARKLDDKRFEICCIPFFLYNLALGDIVETDADYNVVQVVKRSGRFVFRVWFGETFHPRQEIADDLTELGALIEWSSANLLAVDAADNATARLIQEYLDRQESSGHLVHEKGSP